MRRTPYRVGMVAVAVATLLATALLLARPAAAEGLSVSVSDARLAMPGWAGTDTSIPAGAPTPPA